MKKAIVTSPFGVNPEQIARYLPFNYQVLEVTEGVGVIIGGEDYAGWTMEDYVIPRLASGMYQVTPIGAGVSG